MISDKVQGCLVQVHGIGIFIRGRSGSGKSFAALSLMHRGHNLVADDLVEITSESGGAVSGRPVEEDVRIEVRGIGIYRAKSLFPERVIQSCRIDFIADFHAYDASHDSGRIEPETCESQLLQKNILTIRVPLTAGTDPALLIEILALRFRDTGTVKP